jgi:DNA (cytosine-5)-methyltransferase 1
VAPAPTVLEERVRALEAEVTTLRNQVITPVTTVATTNAISLFSGAGGDTLGLERAGYKVIAFNEFNEAAAKTHTTVFPGSVAIMNPETKATDITKVPNEVFAPYQGRVNLIFSGFPCQGFSHAGKKRSDDSRNELVHEFVRATRILQPEWILGENVKGLLARKGRLNAEAPLRPVIDIIRDLFEGIGYRITYRVLDVSTLGVPQNRKRLIIVGHRGLDGFPHMPWETMEAATTPPLGVVRPFLEPHLADAMELPALYKPADQEAAYWIPTTETVVTGTPHKNLDRLVRGIRNRSGAEKAAATVDPVEGNQVIEPDGLISFGVRKGGYHGMVLHPDRPCNTIISTYNLCPRLFVGLHNPAVGKYWIRCMTPRELGQIQGFPADYAWQGTDKQKIIQIGNAVPPPLAERVARTILAGRVVLQKESQVQGGAVAAEDDDEEDEA